MTDILTETENKARAIRLQMDEARKAVKLLEGMGMLTAELRSRHDETVQRLSLLEKSLIEARKP